MNLNIQNLSIEKNDLNNKLQSDTELLNNELLEFNIKLESSESRSKDLLASINNLEETLKTEILEKVIIKIRYLDNLHLINLKFKSDLSNRCCELSKKNEDLIQNENLMSNELLNLRKNIDELTFKNDNLINSLETSKNESSFLQNTLMGLKKVKIYN